MGSAWLHPPWPACIRTLSTFSGLLPCSTLSAASMTSTQQPRGSAYLLHKESGVRILTRLGRPAAWQHSIEAPANGREEQSNPDSGAAAAYSTSRHLKTWCTGMFPSLGCRAA